MKNLFSFMVIMLVVVACTSTKEAGISSSELRKERKIAEQATVKSAVEARRYIIKVDKYYTRYGNVAELNPDHNFLIINGGLATVSLPYVGRSMGSRPISGINFNGQTFDYNMEWNEGKGLYDLNLKVGKGNDTFTIYLTIGKNGFCTFSLQNPMIDHASYKGVLVPIPAQQNNESGSQVII
ncbi:MAG: DUF4251 domain-containing protein [Bacteroidales bacterium]